jgi:hypothetical protein
VFASESDLILEKLQKLENDIKSLKAENAELRQSIESGVSKSSSSDVLDELEERLDSIETMALVNKINFGLGFKTRVDTFDGDYANGDNYRDSNVWSSKLMLDMDSKITDDMKFTGRLSMYKYWAGGPNYVMQDSWEGRKPEDSGLFVERAYIDWTPIKGEIPVTFTIGRQPSSDGPSHHFKDNTVRKSTYSALAFDGSADGVVATVDLQKVTGIDNTAFRLAYGKGYQDHSADTAFMGSDSTLKDTNLVGLFLDSSIPSIAGSLVQVGYVNAKDIYLGGANNLGDGSLMGVMAEFTNLMGSGLDLFAHYGMSKVKPNDKTSDLGMGAPVGLLTTDMSALTGVAPTFDDKTGHAWWVGARYTLPFASKPKIGIEYNKGDENWFNFTSGSNDLTNKLATRGDALEIYYIQPINRYSFIRVGGTWIDYDYTGSGYPVGTPMNINDNKNTGMLPTNTLDKMRNYYLLFNILY